MPATLIAKFSGEVLQVAAKLNASIATLDKGEISRREFIWNEIASGTSQFRRAVQKYHQNDTGLSVTAALDLVKFTDLVSRQTCVNWADEFDICQQHSISAELYFKVGIFSLRADQFNPKDQAPAASVIATWKLPMSKEEAAKRRKELLMQYPKGKAASLSTLLERRGQIKEQVASDPEQYEILMPEAADVEASLNDAKEEFIAEIKSVDNTLAAISKLGGVNKKFVQDQLKELLNPLLTRPLSEVSISSDGGLILKAAPELQK